MKAYSAPDVVSPIKIVKILILMDVWLKLSDFNAFLIKLTKIEVMVFRFSQNWNFQSLTWAKLKNEPNLKCLNLSKLSFQILKLGQNWNFNNFARIPYIWRTVNRKSNPFLLRCILSRMARILMELLQNS